MTTITAPTTKYSSFDAYKLGYSAIAPDRRNHTGRPDRGARSHTPSSHSRHGLNRHFSSRRFLVLFLIAVSVFAVMLPATTAFGRRPLVSSERPSAESNRQVKSATVSVVVRSGDTLWSIARRIEPKRDPREVVDQLVDARGTASVYVGETITWQR